MMAETTFNKMLKQMVSEKWNKLKDFLAFKDC